MNNGTCVTPGCERAVWVKRTGECSTCQSRRYRQDNPGKGRTVYNRACKFCDTPFDTHQKATRYCSLQCKGDDYRIVCKLPEEHPVAQRIRQLRDQVRRPKAQPFTPEVRVCTWCGDDFLAAIRTQIFCSSAHKIKAKRNRRRGRQHGSTSHFTWAEFMRVFLNFDRCCAYCQQPIDGQPDPDHVVPLSRGGSNSITNILPSCRLCNSDKRDLLLHEWEQDRARRGLEPRMTTWNAADSRTVHLTSILTAA